MNPNNNGEHSELSLPTPTFELKEGIAVNKSTQSTPELSKKPVQNITNNATNLVQTQSIDPANMPSQSSMSLSSTDPQSPITPTIAKDDDLIEKEWVTKAKQIVEKTKDDPHKQTKEINQFKAAYIKKRWNKDVKIIDEQ